MPQSPNTPQPAQRSTEGVKPSASHGKGPETTKRRGRPPGSRNKPKSLIPAELAGDILGIMKDRLPAEHFEYMQGVIQKGEAISTVKELDVLITLVRASVMPYLAAEAIPRVMPEFDDDGNLIGQKNSLPGINRDATDRLKLLNSLISLKDTIEKRKSDEDDPDAQPLIVQLAGARGLLKDGGRLGLLIGADPGRTSEPVVVSGSLAGDVDRTGRGALPARTVSDSVPERPES